MKKIILLSLCVIAGSTSALQFISDNGLKSAKYLADLWFIQKRGTDAEYNINSYVTRAELTAIALKFAGEKVPEPYTCKKYFEDVTKNDWVCAVVEKAADIGLISRNNKKFDPQRNISSPEAIALVLRSSKLETKINVDNLSSYEHPKVAFVPHGGSIENWLQKRKTEYKHDTKIVLVDILDWRFSTFQKALYVGILDENFLMPEIWHRKANYEKYKSYYQNYEIYSFREDFPIFRGDIFIIFEEAYKKMQLVSGEVNI
jgi:hypothetical protein